MGMSTEPMSTEQIDAEVARAMAALDASSERVQVGLVVPNGAGAVVKVYDVPLDLLARLSDELEPHLTRTFFRNA